jgi:Tol biopolymer transport system component/DNA-binding winged helix-turn-helix (wHTH) protein
VSVRFYSFDRFRVDSVKRLLLRDGAPVPLTPKAFDILVLLLQRSGGVVEKDDILREIWPDTVVEENNLARNISTLRKVLDDTPGQNRFIVTIPGRGYQFVGDVEESGAPPPHAPTAPSHPIVASGPSPAPGPPAGSPGLFIPGEPRLEPAGSDRLPQPNGGQAVADAQAREGSSRQTPLRALAVALVLITFAAVGYAIRTSRRPPPAEPASPTHQIWQLTFASGLQDEPSWSPDGRMVAFSSDRGGNLDIWIQSVDGGNPVQVTNSPEHDWQPDWSTDGRRLVFRSERGGGGLYVVPILGGAEQQIASFGYHARWSPDGKQILFQRSNFVGRVLGAKELYTVALDDRAPRKMLSAFLNEFGSFRTAWHPDSKRISVWGNHLKEGLTFWTVPLDGSGAPVKSALAPVVRERFKKASVRFADADDLPLSFLWSPSGDALYFEGNSRGVRNIWKVEVEASTLQWRLGPERLTTGADVNAGISLSRDGQKLAFAVRDDRIRLWSFQIDAASGRVAGAGEPITASAFDALSPVLSRDGTQLIFGAERGGTQELWRKSIVDGRETLVVAGDDFHRVGPVWSYDNSRVMYLRSRRDPAGGTSESELVTVPVSGGQEQVLRTEEQVDRLFDWSADGAWILAAAWPRPGAPYELILLPADAKSGAERRVLASDSQSNLWKARLSADQKWVVFTVPTEPGASAIYAVPAAGGDRVKITSGVFFDDRPRWSPDGRIVYFLSSRSGFFNVWARRFDSDRGAALGEPFAVTQFNDPAQTIPPRTVQLGMSISRDRLIIPIASASGNIWVLDGLNR